VRDVKERRNAWLSRVTLVYTERAQSSDSLIADDGSQRNLAAMGRLLCVLLVLGVLMTGCGRPEAPIECAALARLPAPVSGPELDRLQAVADAVAVDPNFRDWAINFVDADESRGTVVVGTLRPTRETCEALRRRYGPRVEVIYSEGVTFFSRSGPDPVTERQAIRS